jgi:hypothetical protein
LNELTLIAASAMHVSELEKEIERLHRTIKNLESTNRKIVNSYNRIAMTVRTLEIELANKVDKIF